MPIMFKQYQCFRMMEIIIILNVNLGNKEYCCIIFFFSSSKERSLFFGRISSLMRYKMFIDRP